MKDLMNNIHPVAAIAPIVVSDDTAQISAAIDLSGYDSCTFVISGGVLADADATFAVTVEEGDDATQANHTAVADVDLIGTEALAGFTFADDGETRKVGYKGGKRYVSITVTPSNNTGSAPISVVALLGHPLEAPTDNPPS